MRRTDREITDFDEIVGILNRADTIRLGLQGEEYPYVVPLSFGFKAEAGAIALYFHGAKEGLKHELLRRNPRVCVEAGIFHRYAQVPNGITTQYESVIGFGTASLVEGGEAAHGVALLLEHCGYAGFAYDPKALEAMAVYKIALESWTGKRNMIFA